MGVTSRLFSFALLLLTSGCAFTMAEQLLDTRRQSFPADGVRSARFETGAGSLTIEGRRGATTIEVIAEFRGRAGSREEERRILESLQLTMEVRGGTFYLKTDHRGMSRWDGGGMIDIVATVPPDIALDIEDGSGGMRVRGMDADVTIEDNSGEVEIDGVKGRLIVKDGSGGIDIRNAGGDVEIEDGSGGIDVRHVQGNIRINDGSGSIDVEDVAGSLDVPSGGSGGVHHRDVRGDVRVPRSR
jgi:hypothetical protein